MNYTRSCSFMNMHFLLKAGNFWNILDVPHRSLTELSQLATSELSQLATSEPTMTKVTVCPCGKFIFYTNPCKNET